MADCSPVVVGGWPALLTVRMAEGEPAGLIVPATGHPLVAPVLEWSASGRGESIAAHPLAPAGVGADGYAQWSVSLAAAQVEALRVAGVRAVRLVETEPARQLLAAGIVEWLSGWAGVCDTSGPTLHVWAVPGPRGNSIVSVHIDAGGHLVLETDDGPLDGVLIPAIQDAIDAAAAAEAARDELLNAVPDMTQIYEDA